MDTPTRSHRGRFEGLAFSQLLALLFLACCVWWVYRDLAIVIGASKITGSITWEQGPNAVLAERLAGFGFAVLLAHSALGLLAWGLARLTRVALPGWPADGLRALIVGWMLLLAFLVLAANASWYAASRFAGENSWLVTDWHGLTPLIAVSAATAAAIITIAYLAVRRAGPRKLIGRRSLIVAALLAVAVALLPMLGVSRPRPATAFDQPHLVILGVDSLRADLEEAADGRKLTPHIDAFLAGAHRFQDTISPLARTYPAWLSILTGRHPVSTNARFNLMPRKLVNEGDTLADALSARGYQSVFATDEVRFANFDESYGFDTLITPPIGASDFVIGTIGDLPLVNLLVGTRIGGWLFPGLHANRAAHVTYRPAHFVDRLDRQLGIDGPSFLAIHLTLSHWPYSWADQEMPSNPPEFRPAYRHALEEVDRQFDSVLRLLKRKGVLDNALVVVLSDHGEALGFPSDSMLRETGTSREIWDSLWGHGTSVMSPHQYGVVFAMRAYGRARLPGGPAVHRWPVSLEDVRPTLEEFATGTAPRQVDGLSLLPFLAGHENPAAIESRIRFTETCFNTLKLMEGKISPSGLVSEAGIYYEMAPDTGWVQLRPERLPEIMAKKQRAALSSDSLLAAIPSWTDGTITYLFTSRQSPLPKRLASRPDPALDPEAARLWSALQARYPGELEAGPELPQM